MAQVGLHALVGLMIGEQALKRLPVRPGVRTFAFAALAGNLLPDLDVLATLGALPMDQAVALALHRGFTHSLVAVLALLGIFGLLYLVLRDRVILPLAAGLAVGMVSHIAVDLFLWFSPVDVFWPASHFGLGEPVNLWRWWTTPDTLGRVLGAGEFVAMGIYFLVLRRRAKAAGTDAALAAPCRRMAALSLTYAAVLLAVASFVPAVPYGLLVLLPNALMTVPACLYLSHRMWATVVTWAPTPERKPGLVVQLPQPKTAGRP